MLSGVPHTVSLLRRHPLRLPGPCGQGHQALGLLCYRVPLDQCLVAPPERATFAVSVRDAVRVWTSAAVRLALDRAPASYDSPIPSLHLLTAFPCCSLSRLHQRPQDPDQGEQPGGAADLHPALRLPLHRRGPVRLRAHLRHPLPQPEGPAAAVAPVPER